MKGQIDEETKISNLSTTCCTHSTMVAKADAPQSRKSSKEQSQSFQS